MEHNANADAAADHEMWPLGQECPFNDQASAEHTWASQYDAAPITAADCCVQEPNYADFEKWIPHFAIPSKACDYCKSKKLSCYLQRGEGSCSACNALFRECSLTSSPDFDGRRYPEDASLLLDTLHSVQEDVASEHGNLTGVKPLMSMGTNTKRHGHALYSAPSTSDDAPGSSARNGIRFSRNAVKVLRDWLEAHADNPYPTEEEKVDLERKTELKPSQIANWLANARRRRKGSEGVRPKRGVSPSIRSSTSAINIPTNLEKTWDELNPLERWKNSPPEHEPAAISDIAHAVATSDLCEIESRSVSSGRRKRSSNGSGVSSLRDVSATSLGTTARSSTSAASAGASHHSSNSHGSFGSFSSSLGGKKDRRRRRQPRPMMRKSPSTEIRMFQCTFCTDTFKSKYDWTRHEKSLHLSLEKWICHPDGPTVVDTTSGKETCAYCSTSEPSHAHIESHNHRSCQDKGLEARTFYRKDHLRQHLRLMHACELLPSMDAWRTVAANVSCRCGFCGQRFSAWQERTDHLTAHFKAGARMMQWKGCRGLDPSIAAQVTNAMPPYLIGVEAISPQPFSATNRASWHGVSDGFIPPVSDTSTGLGNDTQPPNASSISAATTCWEMLTVKLGKYVNSMIRENVPVSDEMLQAHARVILYDSDDTWNQTPADNSEWLDLFKKAHGLDIIPSAVGGQGSEIPEDLEWYGDLGLRIPFAVQLQQYNETHTSNPTTDRTRVDGPFYKAIERRKQYVRDMCVRLHQSGVLHDENTVCEHQACRQNIIDVKRIGGLEDTGLQKATWCSHDLPADLARELHLSTGVAGPNEAHGGVSHGLQTLFDLEERLYETEGWQWQQYDPRVVAAVQAGAFSDPSTVPPTDADTPANMRTNYSNKTSPAYKEPATKSYAKRHRAELPPAKAKRFTTITGPWEDSGIMPETIHTADTAVYDDATMSGGMLEYLSGNLSSDMQFDQFLPFSNAVTSSTMSIPTSDAWVHDGHSSMYDPAVMQEIDDMIAAATDIGTATGGNAQYLLGGHDSMKGDNWITDVAGEHQPLTSHGHTGEIDMGDMTFEDLTFDGAFDLSMDAEFPIGPASGPQ